MQNNFPTSVVNWLIAALFFLGVVYVLLQGAALVLRFRESNRTGERDLNRVTEGFLRSAIDEISGAIRQIWIFARPIVHSRNSICGIYVFADDRTERSKHSILERPRN
jgi:hypothetical protein